MNILVCFSLLGAVSAATIPDTADVAAAKARFFQLYHEQAALAEAAPDIHQYFGPQATLNTECTSKTHSPRSTQAHMPQSMLMALCRRLSKFKLLPMLSSRPTNADWQKPLLLCPSQLLRRSLQSTMRLRPSISAGQDLSLLLSLQELREPLIM